MAPQHRQAEQRQSRTDISAPGKAFGTPGHVRQNVADIFRRQRCQEKRNSWPGQTIACNYQRDRSGNHCRSEEHTSELQSLMRTSYAVFCMKTKTEATTTQISDRSNR